MPHCIIDLVEAAHHYALAQQRLIGTSAGNLHGRVDDSAFNGPVGAALLHILRRESGRFDNGDITAAVQRAHALDHHGADDAAADNQHLVCVLRPVIQHCL